MSAPRAYALAAAIVLLAVLVWYERPWEPHISSGSVEREIAHKLTKARSVSCHRAGNDGSIPLDDVDYACDVDFGDFQSTWWVGTDWHRITATTDAG